MRADVRSLALAGCVLLCAGAPAFSQTPTPGQNVNMVSGTKFPGGDPWLQRQQEPSIAVSSRNPLHVLGGANDYRTVDLPTPDDALPNQTLAGDAWLGLFKSFDGGQTWRSTLLPGYPQDQSKEGLALKTALQGQGLVFTTASDPVVRPGTNGLFYYAGIGFNRATGKGAVFVARFIDMNNRENGIAAPTNISDSNTDPIRYLGTTVPPFAISGDNEFLDKPWIAVDKPRAGAPTCTLVVPQANGSVTQGPFPAGNVYLVYTKFFLDSAKNPISSRLYVTRSTDCGQTFSAPVPLVAIDELFAPSTSVHQGATIQVDPQAGFVYVAWRRFHNSKKPDSLFITASIDRGRSFFPGIPVVSYPPSPDPLHPVVPTFFDQGTTGFSVRTNAFPALAVDDSGVPGWPGRVYLAWSQRMGPYGDARIMLLDFPGSFALSSTGLSLVPSLADSPPAYSPSCIPVVGTTCPLPGSDRAPLRDISGQPFSRGTQFMPQLSFVGGKLLAVYYDQRLDHTVLNLKPMSPFAPDLLGRFFTENYVYPTVGDLPVYPSLVFGPFLSDACVGNAQCPGTGLLLRRHTIDVVAAEAPGGLHPQFTVTRVSHYKTGTRPGSKLIEQLQVNPPGLPLFTGGKLANIGDYLDIGGQTFVPSGNSWVFNTAKASSPVRIAAWTTNQDVRPPKDGHWENYTAVATVQGQPSTLDGSPLPVSCQIGQEGMRNQNIYSSRISEGLAVFSPQNTKPLNSTFQRVFVVVVQNLTMLKRAFRLTISRQPTRGVASFLQTQSLLTLEVDIGPHAGIARPVFATSSLATDSITVNVDEITLTDRSIVPGGLSGFVVLNGDGSSPTLIDPECPPPPPPPQPPQPCASTSIASGEAFNPDLANPDLANPDLANPDLANPDLANPDLANPDLANPDLANPDLANPDLANFGVTNPDLANPDLANPDLANFSVSEASYTLTNEGNTNASYKIRLVGTLPSDPTLKLQLIISKRYLTPVAYQCTLTQEAQNTVQANVMQPPVTDPTNPDLANPDLANSALSNATVALGPGETARVTIRANVTVARLRLILANITPVATAQAANTGAASTGGTPQISLALTAQLPDGVVGTPYVGALHAFGGRRPYTFSAVVVPGGLVFNPATGAIFSPEALPVVLDPATGAIGGTPSVATVFPPQGENAPGADGLLVVFQVTDFDGRKATRTLLLRIATPLAINLPRTETGSVTIPTAVQGTAYRFLLPASGGIGPYTWTANGLPEWLTLSPGGALSGTPPAAGGFTFDLTVRDTASPAQSATANVTLTVTPQFGLNFLVQPTNTTPFAQITPAVSVRALDMTGASVPGIPITITLGNNPGAGTLSGGGPVLTNSDGVATFPSLAIAAHSGSGYTLIASSNGASTTSNAFDLIAGFITSGAVVVNPRYLHTATLLPDGRVLIAGGETFIQLASGTFFAALASAEIYDPATDTFAPTGGMFDGETIYWREAHTATLLTAGPNAGKVLVVGGQYGSPPSAFWATAQLYDPATGTFGPAILMVEARAFHTATLLDNGNVLIAGGRGYDANRNTTDLSSSEIYDATANAFVPAEDMIVTRELHTATTLSDGRILIAGGRGTSDGFLTESTYQLYDGTTFSAATFVAGLGFAQSATRLDSGDVLIAGGVGITADQATTLVWSAVEGGLGPGDSMAVARHAHTATLLPDGRVLIFGGLTGCTSASDIDYLHCGVITATSEIFEPATGFSPGPVPDFGRRGHTATLLLDGSVLIVGYASIAERFMP